MTDLTSASFAECSVPVSSRSTSGAASAPGPAEGRQAPDATLRESAAAAPAAGPWREIFEGHLTGLTELTVRIKTVRDTNTQFVNHASRSTQETLATLGGEPRTYDATGATTDRSDVARLFDTVL